MKFKDPFNRHDLRVRYRLECLEVGFDCRQSNRFHWLTLKARRWSAKAEAEAKTLALQLMRESAKRWEDAANEALAKQRALLRECALLENGLKVWEQV